MILESIKHFFVFPFAPKKALSNWKNRKPDLRNVFVIFLLFVLFSLLITAVSVSLRNGHKLAFCTRDSRAYFFAGEILGITFRILIYSAFVFAINRRWKKNYDFMEISFHVVASFFPLLFLNLTANPAVVAICTLWFLFLLFYLVKTKFSFPIIRSVFMIVAIYFLVLAISMMFKGIEI